MKTGSKAALAIVVVTFLFTGCSQKQKAEAKNNSSIAACNVSITSKDSRADAPVIKNSLATSAALETNRDSSHKFIRTADVKFKSKSVAEATYKIEDITRQLGGYVSYTNLTSTANEKSEVAISADSSLQTTRYNVQNTMIIRVPNTNLDSALRAMTPLVEYLDLRLVKANDASLQLLTNRLKEQRIARHEGRMNKAIDEHGNKLAETASTADGLLDRQEQADNAQIDNLTLNDQVKYSTINLALYQDETTEKQLVYNEKSIKPYEPGFKTQLSESVQFGWSLFEELILLIAKLWPLLIAVVVGVMLYRRNKIKLA